MGIRTHEEWRKLLIEYRSSQETAESFCKRHQINTSTLYYWLAKDAKPKSQVKMLPMVSQEAKTNDAVELLMAKGDLTFLVGCIATPVSGIRAGHGFALGQGKFGLARHGSGFLMLFR
jgi:hypothetical protein